MTRERRRLGWFLAFLFMTALGLGAGPGILLVNRPGTVSLAGLEVPYLYAWGVLWYAVEALCIVVAYFFLWRGGEED